MNTSGNGNRNRMISLIVLVALAGQAAEIKFETHRIGRFRGEACAVADFNNDGRLDIIAGSFWYEAPDWKPRRFRFLEGMIDPQGNNHTVDDNGKGYYDDFTNIPLDIDKDGLTDVVTCSWFSKRFDWYRNTGSTSMTWPMTISDEGVNFEAGDLCDIDGDGKKIEILPHCKDTRWYEIGNMNLVVHSVSSRELNYGGGVGDINGDGRPDIVRPDAWYQAPADPRKEEWTEHPLSIGNIEQGKSEHTPQIWVYDV
ncbi:MAG TPA: VCBS repeat-containing protein, partial [Sedimentisphaerales bacterium]|nr:VCBS repeat-containing protein [Sedimentisphaerales bacterium]